MPEAKGVRAAEDMTRELVEGHEAVVRTRARDLSDRRRGEPTTDLLTREKPRGFCARCSLLA
ncbi:hypothetical protein WL14_14310 [Burkholderia cepacia]|nr:hypothetical protein WJ46_36240 [Burkholderia cepacia]KVQ32100.1 hypothetical protein WK02_13865 [Burkholderia cepacia]KVZ22964.1 hypothetical protein WL14_14310 [Burkholderia cepacia]